MRRRSSSAAWVSRSSRTFLRRSNSSLAKYSSSCCVGFTFIMAPVSNGTVRPPLEIGRAWHIAAPLDRELLGRAAKLFLGRHDFAAFAANRGKKERSTVRTMKYVRVTGRRDLLEIEFSADGFLYKMVRLKVGAIARCAHGKESLH